MIVVGGENLIDLIQQPSGHFAAIAGGSPYNTARAAARQGQPTGYLTPVSSDRFGDILADTFTADGGILLSPRATVPSSLAVVTLSGGQPAYQFYREGTAERAVTGNSLVAALPDAARIFSVGSLALAGLHDGPAWAACFKVAKARGLFCAIDPNIRPAFIADEPAFRDRLAALLADADMVKLSDEDIAWISPDLPVKEAAAALAAQHDIPLLVLTLGAEGALAFHNGTTHRQDGIPATPLLDTVGAGDTFMGSLLAQMQEFALDQPGALAALSTARLAKILHRAAKAAAINCTREGCNPPLLAELA
ncbi:MAG: carbohydrate kinase [Paracoccaceae bacterium]